MFLFFFVCVIDELKILIIGLEKVLCGDKVCFEVEVKLVEFLNWLIIW